MTAINPSWPDPASVEAAQHWAARAEAAAKPDIAMMIRHARQEAILLGGDQKSSSGQRGPSPQTSRRALRTGLAARPPE